MVQQTPLTAEDVRRLCGDISDWKVAEILSFGGDLAALELAKAWSMDDDETTPARHLSPESPAARILDVLTADEEEEE